MSEAESCYPLVQANAPGIELVQMSQRMNIKDRQEDWTGKSDTGLRRKLQNRLNQRASRARRKQAEQMQGYKNATPVAEQIRVLCQYDPNGPPIVYIHDPKAPRVSPLVARPRYPEGWCVPHLVLNSMLQICDFQSFKFTPLPSDQKLLTLMHFNLVRGLCHIVDALGYRPHELYMDVQSPLVDPAYQAEGQKVASTTLTNFFALPTTVQPTLLQKVMPHHPEYDIFPFPRYRDNVIMAYHKKTINPPELCMDVCYGVGTGPIWGDEKTKEPGTNDMVNSGSKTGLIVWSTPWLQSSWEIEEVFGRKYAFLFEGCDELLVSTNVWREIRGKEPLTFWPFNTVERSNTYLEW